jgi:hypothetical protein
LPDEAIADAERSWLVNPTFTQYPADPPSRPVSRLALIPTMDLLRHALNICQCHNIGAHSQSMSELRICRAGGSPVATPRGPKSLSKPTSRACSNAARQVPSCGQCSGYVGRRAAEFYRNGSSNIVKRARKLRFGPSDRCGGGLFHFTVVAAVTSRVRAMTPFATFARVRLWFLAYARIAAKASFMVIPEVAARTPLACSIKIRESSAC